MLVLVVLAVAGWWMRREGFEFDSLGTSVPTADGVSGGEDHREGYDRKDWPHWSDVDRDCQDTRQEVLIAESEIPVTFKTSKRCKVKKGRWRCPYTGRIFTDPRKLDVDHLVPLAEAHRSGGHAWDRKRRGLYANELGRSEHLVAVEAGSNRAKADKGPDAWMPADKGYRCEYLEAWRGVKEHWRLHMDAEERRYVEQAQQTCAQGKAPALPPGQRR